MRNSEILILLGRQETYRGKIVDIRLGSKDMPILVELKLYYDKADWKESRSMKNTVENDLKTAKGHKNTFVGIIDVVPSTYRAKLVYSLNWNILEIDRQVFDSYYRDINPISSPPRERKQQTLLVNGTQI
jgi:hypothetical protein